MGWLSRLFGQQHDQESRSRQEVAFKQASRNLGKATLNLLRNMEKTLRKPTKALARLISAEDTLNDIESTLSRGVLPASQTENARKRISKLRQKLSQLE